MENKFTPELIAKARQAKSPEELLALAKENGITITENEARDYFAQLHESCNKSGELSDDELANVAGGGCYNDDGRLVVTSLYSCKRFECKRCGNTGTHICHEMPFYLSNGVKPECDECKYYEKHVMRRLCNHPLNYKR